MTNRIKQVFLLLMLVLCAMFITPRPAAAQAASVERLYVVQHSVWRTCQQVRKLIGTPADLRACSDDTLDRNNVDAYHVPKGMKLKILVNAVAGEAVGQNPNELADTKAALEKMTGKYNALLSASNEPAPATTSVWDNWIGLVIFLLIGIALGVAGTIGLRHAKPDLETLFRERRKTVRKTETAQPFHAAAATNHDGFANFGPEPDVVEAEFEEETSETDRKPSEAEPKR